MKSFSNVLRFKSVGSINIDMTQADSRGNDACGAQWASAKPVKTGKPRRNKALAAMKRENRKKNRK